MLPGLKERLLGLINDPAYTPLKKEELALIFDIHPTEMPMFYNFLEELEEDGYIGKTKKGKIASPKSMGYFVGKFVAHRKGFGFVESDEEYTQDLFIPAADVNGAMHNDRVVAEITKPATDERRAEGAIIKVLEREITKVVGEFQSNKTFGFVIADEKKFNQDIYIPKKYFSGAKDGDKVVVRLTDFGGERKKPEGAVIEILGAMDDPATDVTSIVRAYGIEEEFPKSVIKEAQAIPQEITEQPVGKRADFRDLLTVTIDGEDARDLDDAITLSKKEDKYYLGVHIADVSHYVKEDSPLDKEALERATSVYLADRVIPMLPKELSNGICSLNAGVERLAMSCMMTFDASGNVLDHTITESVICVDERMSYTGVKAILEGEAHPEGKREDIRALCFLMKEAAAILKEKRRKRGAIDFDFPESKIVVDEKGYPVDIHPYERNVATDIIEDFMLLANETVAEDYFWQEIPFVYRTHEAPDSDKIKKLDTFIHNFGYYMKTGRESFHPKEIQKLLFSLEGEPEEPLISRLALRSMKQAKYTTLNVGHFGLSTQYYTHFTSPIRRYPDLQIHRIIKENIHGKLNQKRLEHYESILPSVAQQSSTMERRAQDAEREVDKLKKVEYMQQYIGGVFTGVISGVTSWGFFVELDNTIEGMVPINSLLDDFYVFDEESYKLTGEHTGRIFTLGQKAEIVVRSADKMERTIDFILKEFSQYGEYPDPDDYYGDGMPSRKKENTESEDFEFVDGEYPANQEESEFDETGESLPDKDGILLNDWIDDEEADRLLHLYSKKKIDEI